MWLSTIAFLTAIGFLIRSFRTFQTSLCLLNTLLCLFSLWAALIFLPAPFSESITRTFGAWSLLAASAYLILSAVGQVFQGIRRYNIGKFFVSSGIPAEIGEVCHALERMAAKRMGALIVLQRNDALDPLIRSGLQFDGDVKSDIIVSLFATTSPVHDGAMIIANGRIKALRVVLPLATRSEIPMGVGTRHRSAIGITERADCVVLIVSEERGTISIAVNGEITGPVPGEQLTNLVMRAIKGKEIGTDQANSNR